MPQFQERMDRYEHWRFIPARSIAFVIISVVPFATGWSLWLEAVAVGMIILQVLDACVGVAIRDRMKTLGPAAIAVANLAVLVWLISR